MVDELGKEYAGKLTSVVRVYNEGDSQDLIKKYEMDVHGMVITDEAGAKVWMESGHLQKKAEVVAAIDDLLGG